MRLKRLYKNNGIFTDEARNLSFQIETMIQEYVKKNERVDLNDLKLVFIDSASLACCRAIIDRRRGMIK